MSWFNMDAINLSARESQIMRLLGARKTPYEIADEVGASLRTVEFDILRLRARYKARDVPALRAIARRACA